MTDCRLANNFKCFHLQVSKHFKIATSAILAGFERLMTLTRVSILVEVFIVSYFLRFLLTKEDLGFSNNSTYSTSLKYS